MKPQRFTSKGTAFAVFLLPLPASALTLDDLDPLTRGICEQMEINAQCPAPEAPIISAPKQPTTDEPVRPKPRPDWCETPHAWRFNCEEPLTILMAQHTGVVFAGSGVASAASGGVGGGGGGGFGGSGSGGAGGSASASAAAEALSQAAALAKVTINVTKQGSPEEPSGPPAVIPLGSSAWFTVAGLIGLGVFVRKSNADPRIS